MPPRSLPTRLLAALLALWLAVYTAEPAALHACPVHSGAAHGATAHAGAMHGAIDHGGTGAHDRAPASGDRHAPARHCTCPDHCCAAGACGLPSARVALDVATVRVETARRTELALRVADRAPRLLPFANGPPRLS